MGIRPRFRPSEGRKVGPIGALILIRTGVRPRAGKDGRDGRPANHGVVLICPRPPPHGFAVHQLKPSSPPRHHVAVHQLNPFAVLPHPYELLNCFTPTKFPKNSRSDALKRIPPPHTPLSEIQTKQLSLPERRAHTLLNPSFPYPTPTRTGASSSPSLSTDQLFN
jgi:hypothetical protein